MRDEVIRLARQGHRPTVIASLLGRERNAVTVALHRARTVDASVPRFRPGPSPDGASGRAAAERRRTVAALAEGGLEPREIAARMGIGASAVSALLSRMRSAGFDIPRAPAGRPRLRAAA